ncbi:hypothetical protein BJX99DRAFT_259022 [Aspergillus californicus]
MSLPLINPDDIDRWIDNTYAGSREFRYEKRANKVKEMCAEALDLHKIQYIITSRSKDKESLRAKLKNILKYEKRNWTSTDDFDQVFDIAGVRIALYLPEEEELVNEIIAKECGFIMSPHDTANFPYLGNPSTGNQDTKLKYKATHFIVCLKDREPIPVEIQVMSVLGSSWAQIQHDYTYKKVNKGVSAAESSTLEAFKRAVNLSEEILEQLGKLRKQRHEECFKTIYDLGSFLSQWWGENHRPHVGDLGSLNALQQLLNLETLKGHLNSRGKLDKFLTDHVSTGSINEVNNPFPNLEVQPVAITIYYIIKKFRGDLYSRPLEPIRLEKRRYVKLKTIMSTILWLSELFPPSYWEKELRGRDVNDRERVQRLHWLASAQPSQFIQRPATFNSGGSNEDRDAVDYLWDLFSGHTSPAVKLAFDVSNAGIAREIKAEIELFNRVYMALGTRLKNELENNNNGS